MRNCLHARLMGSWCAGRSWWDSSQAGRPEGRRNQPTASGLAAAAAAMGGSALGRATHRLAILNLAAAFRACLRRGCALRPGPPARLGGAALGRRAEAPGRLAPDDHGTHLLQRCLQTARDAQKRGASWGPARGRLPGGLAGRLSSSGGYRRPVGALEMPATAASGRPERVGVSWRRGQTLGRPCCTSSSPPHPLPPPHPHPLPAAGPGRGGHADVRCAVQAAAMGRTGGGLGGGRDARPAGPSAHPLSCAQQQVR